MFQLAETKTKTKLSTCTWHWNIYIPINMKAQHEMGKHLSLQCSVNYTYICVCLHEDETLFTLSKVSKVSIMVQWWMGGVFNSWSWQMKAGTILTPGRARSNLVLDLSFIIIQVKTRYFRLSLRELKMV